MTAVISSTVGLEGFIAESLVKAPWVAIDTEFMRRRTYFPQLCVAQLASPAGRVAVVDALAPMELDPLWELLNNRRIIKIFHAASQDLEAVYAAGGGLPLPAPVFDTQKAAELAGYGRSMGLWALAKRITELPPDAQEDGETCVSDWSRRPMTAAQMQYAARDVLFVREAYLHLCPKLEAANKLNEAVAQSAELVEEVTKRLDPKNAAVRLLKRRKLNPAKLKKRELAALERLARWRETEAIRKNLPRQWIVKDDVLCKAAYRLPQNRRELVTECRGDEKFAGGKYGKQLLEQVAAIRAGA